MEGGKGANLKQDTGGRGLPQLNIKTTSISLQVLDSVGFGYPLSFIMANWGAIWSFQERY